MDQYDRAQVEALADAENARERQRLAAARTPKLLPKRECYNPLCCEPLPDEQLYCNAKCATEHARRSK